MDKRPELVVFSENKIGGVQSYYHNLLLQDVTNQFQKRWIFTDDPAATDSRMINLPVSFEQLIYSLKGKSQYTMDRELSALISKAPGIVVTNHLPELRSLHQYPKKRKTVIYVCHDELYISAALKYESLIDVFIAHNPYFFEVLKKGLPPDRLNDIYYLPYGIRLSSFHRVANHHGVLKILFIARLTEKKGIYDLAKIDDELIARKIAVDWTIVGDGPDKAKLTVSLNGRANFRLLTPATTDEIFEIAAKHDIYILPSYLDGLPVALLEAMSAGLVPVISRFNDGIGAVVEPDNGFIVPVGNIYAFADKIAFLHNDRSELETRSIRALANVRTNFEASVRAKEYYNLFRRFLSLKKPYRRQWIEGDGRLDRPYIPRFVRDGIRGLKNRISKVR